MPIDWDELGRKDIRGAWFNLRNVVARIAERGDAWSAEPPIRQTLTQRVIDRLEAAAARRAMPVLARNMVRSRRAADARVSAAHPRSTHKEGHHEDRTHDRTADAVRRIDDLVRDARGVAPPRNAQKRETEDMTRWENDGGATTAGPQTPGAPF